jgi:hypothetical protein
MSKICANVNLNVVTNHACGDVLSHVSNVLGKNSLGGHGHCVEMHVHMQMNHVGKEKQMF